MCCDVCTLSYHLGCLDPPRTTAPPEDPYECEVCVERKYDGVLGLLEETEGTYDRSGEKGLGAGIGLGSRRKENVKWIEREVGDIFGEYIIEAAQRKGESR